LKLWSTGKVSESQKRILILQILGESWEVLQLRNGADHISKFFNKTGCNITADGTNDSLILPEGLTEYTVDGDAEPPAKWNQVGGFVTEGVKSQQRKFKQQHASNIQENKQELAHEDARQIISEYDAEDEDDIHSGI